MDDASGREVGGANSDGTDDGANGTADVMLAGPEWPGRSVWRRWRVRWHASGPSTQALLVSTLVSAVAALGFLTAAGRSQPRQHHRTVYATARPGPLTVDSAGCPVRVRCVVLAQVDPLLTAALHRTFPGVDVVSSVVVRDAGSGRTYRRVVVARSAGTTLIVSAQCIPGTSAGPRRVLRTAPSTAIERRTVPASQRLEIIVPGRAGCSASVESDVAAGTRLEDARVFALADDPAVQAIAQ